MENLIKMDDLGVPLFLETPICIDSRVSLPNFFNIQPLFSFGSHEISPNLSWKNSFEKHLGNSTTMPNKAESLGPQVPRMFFSLKKVLPLQDFESLSHF